MQCELERNRARKTTMDYRKRKEVANKILIIFQGTGPEGG